MLEKGFLKPNISINKLGRKEFWIDLIIGFFFTFIVNLKKLKNKHSAVESNINELEHRRLDRCLDRGYKNYKLYIAMGVCAYNLKK